MKKINAFQLKVFALVLMLFDHLYFAFPETFPLWIHPLTRVVSPIFGFLLVEGFFHTRNRIKYNVRLFVWAIFMELGNQVLNIMLSSKGVEVHNNIFATLAVGLLLMNVIEYTKKQQGVKKVLFIILTILLLPLSLLTEGGITLVLFILITYFFRENRKKQLIGYIILCLITFFGFSYVSYPTIEQTILGLMFNSDFLFILVVPFIFMYNGERGMNNKFSKYLFYGFYPLHLWIIAIVQFFLK